MVFLKEASLQQGEEFLKIGEERDEKRLLNVYLRIFMSQKSNKLTSFDEVFRKGRSLKHGSVQIFFIKNEKNIFSWGVAVSSKRWRKAVQRNKIKRKLKEAFYPFEERIEKGFKIVLLFCGQSVDISVLALKEDMESVLRKAGLLTIPS
ncbi:MAG: ribonuclease P protein component [Candidatus Moranbacteria bacterium]|nr:ribonuclease P protein component [Candidatus Moranbacteria bacterium]